MTTYSDLAALEPKLAELADRTGRVCPFCADALWEQRGGLKTELKLLVGAHAEKEELASSDCYKIAYDHLCYRVLPATPEKGYDDHARGAQCYYAPEPGENEAAPTELHPMALPNLATGLDDTRATLMAEIAVFQRQQRRKRTLLRLV